MEPLIYLLLLSRYKQLKGASGLPRCGLHCVVKAVCPGKSTFCSDHVKDRASFLGFDWTRKEGKMGITFSQGDDKAKFWRDSCCAEAV